MLVLFTSGSHKYITGADDKNQHHVLLHNYSDLSYFPTELPASHTELCRADDASENREDSMPLNPVVLPPTPACPLHNEMENSVVLGV